nr:hypothetical protein [Bacillus cereus]
MIYPNVTSSNFPIKMVNGRVEQNPNMRSRCGCDNFGPCSTYNHGQSYLAVDYNHGIGPGKYNILITVQRYGEEYYGTGQDAWYRFQHAPGTYTGNRTSKLGGPGAAGREFYFRNGNNQTPGLRTGALGVEVFDKRTDRSLGWGLWYFTAGWSNDWGREWYRCGQDYGFWFEDK